MLTQIQNLISWIDNEGSMLDAEDVRDHVRVHLLLILQKFIAYPHCENFSLMPEPGTS